MPQFFLLVLILLLLEDAGAQLGEWSRGSAGAAWGAPLPALSRICRRRRGVWLFLQVRNHGSGNLKGLQLQHLRDSGIFPIVQGDGCGYTLLGPESGTLTSINYPHTYPNSTVCEWEIRVKVGERVRIKFGDFDIEDSDSCHFNYLRIYNGIGVSRTEIGRKPLFLQEFQDNYGNVMYYVKVTKKSSLSFRGHLSTSLFTFKTSGCYGTLGMESGVIADPQITASSVLEWTDHTGRENSWKPEKARLKKPGPPWAPFATDEYQWLQIDLNKEKKITGIITTGSTMVEHNYYVSAYKILYSDDGQKWTVYREPGVEQDKIFQGNKDYHQDVRNNFLPPIIARFIRVNPIQWQQKIAMKVELLGCQFIPKGRPPKFTQAPPPRNSNDLKNTTAPPKIAKGHAPKFTHPLQPRSGNEFPAQTEQTTASPDIKNTTVTPDVTKDVALAAVLVPVLVMVLTTLILILVCAWHWRNRKKKTEGTYDLPYWDRAGWWKGMKQFLPAKSVEHEETLVHYSSSEVNHLSRPREVSTVLQTDAAEYAQPLVGGIVGTLHQRSTFKPEEGKEAGYADLDPYNSPVQEVYHAYAEPLPITGPEYATPIVMDMSGHPAASVGLPSTSTFKATGNQPPPLGGTYNTLLSRTDSCSSARAQYDTPKGGKPGPGAPDELVYQVPQSTQEVSGAGREGECDVFKEIL
ncbi:discoidin, CUB and LCCL domain-containing protein 2 [Trichechus manatus latirostris]|uniref:Discoidin, CUB and LCCL domain-containing protein 2 n=1 Tax=Trichechus manatus latirostris TaxID=127582 RepID=A0A2Y9QI10_TRIMA|nr:discoidin, CUB and LCCL domain-containing protein 2 [Trichechus manatus latirostris]